MRMGILAAGRGERLARAGISVPKPLVHVGGKPLIARMIEAGARLGASSVACVVNDLNPAVSEFIRRGAWPIPVDLVVMTTANSMESLFSLAPFLAGGPFLLSTVDAVCGPGMLEGFVAEAAACADASGALALTRFVDDEKPLWAAIDERRRITQIGDAARDSGYVTAGFYYLTPAAFGEIDRARRKKLNALRQFLAHLVDAGYALYGVPVGRTVDVDYPQDIEKAEACLKESRCP